MSLCHFHTTDTTLETIKWFQRESTVDKIQYSSSQVNLDQMILLFFVIIKNRIRLALLLMLKKWPCSPLGALGKGAADFSELEL